VLPRLSATHKLYIQGKGTLALPRRESGLEIQGAEPYLMADFSANIVLATIGLKFESHAA